MSILLFHAVIAYNNLLWRLELLIRPRLFLADYNCSSLSLLNCYAFEVLDTITQSRESIILSNEEHVRWKANLITCPMLSYGIEKYYIVFESLLFQLNSS